MEDNKLIAEFMGMEKERHADGRYLFTNDLEEAKGTDTRFTEELYFHLSWDWLMPVVKKITQETKEGRLDSCLYTPIASALIRWTDRELVYEAVVEFIKEYNLKS